MTLETYDVGLIPLFSLKVSCKVFMPCTGHVWQKHLFLFLNSVPEYQSASILKCHRHHTTLRAVILYISHSCKLKQRQNVLWCKIQCYYMSSCRSFNANLLFHMTEIDISIACAQMSGGNIRIFWTVGLKLSFHSSTHSLLPQHPKKKAPTPKLKRLFRGYSASRQNELYFNHS